jgi:hypothetical protein
VQGDIKLAVITAHSPHYPANIAELQRATSFLFLRKKFFLGKPLFYFDEIRQQPYSAGDTK